MICARPSAFGKIGIGICWDQWFPETARSLAINGAEMLLYPTAIGSEPILDCDSAGHWRRTMQGHSAANVIPVIAANRIGTESVEPCAENGGQRSSLKFYGSSFITDERRGSARATLSPTRGAKKKPLFRRDLTLMRSTPSGSTGDFSATDDPNVTAIFAGKAA